MNQPLDFVAHDLELMMPGSQPMLTGGPMYNTMSPGPFGSQSGPFTPPNPYGSTYGKPFWYESMNVNLLNKIFFKIYF
jgi:hypothetical protein